MSHPQMASIVINVILQASPPPKTQAVSAQTSLELLSSNSPQKSESSISATEKPSDQPVGADCTPFSNFEKIQILTLALTLVLQINQP